MISQADTPSNPPNLHQRSDDQRSAGHGLPNIGAARTLNPLYSHLVRFFKYLLPFFAFVLVVAVIAWPYLQKDSIQMSIGFATGILGESEDPTMVNPRYTGVDKDNQPFAVTADLAHNLVMDTDHVELQMPKADIGLKDGSWMAVTAETGVFDRSAKSLDLAGSVNLFHDLGYELNTDVLHINIQARTAESAVTVRGQGPIGDLLSEGVRLNNETRVIVFTGKARLILYPDVMGGAQ
ncbi:MAG: LPS export ABC transporter periplasmic protein LptC [Rhodospirillales bacterium]|nr:LPS export ABC transporter periplasmic protein LptC [Rhodospirillales bacterium]MBT4040696.1 LPS export ABC transporter periplasmic protein LptC [Rhodospirillales bacterium]MBT4626317.1 LPS export ABC transporter periplasmic protein LptC [Rhodospirillales bacterium]MBT5353016.1 LPS export ABC transporter periplasmic protein LptC [Rhodospirillales bacterium]MBT5520493.1 LPS export ABC transporter periplasmic protein LptC [Rhodospirillales bacterium]